MHLVLELGLGISSVLQCSSGTSCLGIYTEPWRMPRFQFSLAGISPNYRKAISVPPAQGVLKTSLVRPALTLISGEAFLMRRGWQWVLLPAGGWGSHLLFLQLPSGAALVLGPGLGR